MTLKEQIIKLHDEGVINKDISEKLNCSTAVVSYHLDPNRSEKLKERRENNRKNSPKIKKPHPLHDKQISINIVPVCWKYAEMICIAKLTELGYDVFSPVCGGGEIDFIIHNDNYMYRVQVKSITPVNNEFISLSLSRNSVNYKSRVSSNYTKIDWFLIFDGNNIYKIESKELGKNTNLTLRYKLPINNQTTKIKMAKDYIFCSI